MEKKNISQKQFRRISTMIITGLGTLVILLTLAVAGLFYQSKENEKELASIEHKMKKGNVHNKDFYEQDVLKPMSGKKKAQVLASMNNNSLVEMAYRLDVLELRLAKYDNKFGVNTMNPYTDKSKEMKKDEKNEVGKYLEEYYAKGFEPTKEWKTLSDSGEYKEIRNKLFPTIPENVRVKKDKEDLL